MILAAYFFFVLGLFFMVFGVLGLLKFPDVYTRIHPAGKAGTAGVLSLLIGLMFYAGFSVMTLRLILIALFIVVTSPVASHVIARGAQGSGLEPWQPKKSKKK